MCAKTEYCCLNFRHLDLTLLFAAQQCIILVLSLVVSVLDMFPILEPIVMDHAKGIMQKNVLFETSVSFIDKIGLNLAKSRIFHITTNTLCLKMYHPSCFWNGTVKN